MADDLTQEYLQYRDTAEKENGPLADFLRENASHFVQPEEPVEAQVEVPTEGAPAEPKPKSTFRKVLDYTEFMVRPLGALQEAAVAPIAHQFPEGQSFLEESAEAFKVSGRAFKTALFPPPPGQQPRPRYEEQILKDRFPDIPEFFKPAAETFLAIGSDPAVLAFPFLKSIRAGLSVRAAEKGGAGPWRRGLEEMVTFAPTKDEEAARLLDLATKADAGDAKAATELVQNLSKKEEIYAKMADEVGPEKAAEIRKAIDNIQPQKAIDEKVAAQQIDETIGSAAKPKVLVEPLRKSDTEKFIDLPTDKLPTHAVNINLSKINSADDVKDLITKTSKMFKKDINEARRGVQTNKTTETIANFLGTTPEELLTRRKGQAFNAEEALAARNLLVSSAESLKQMAVKVLEPNAGNLDKIAFTKQLALHRALQQQVSGVTAEAGRVLQQFNIGAKSTKAQLARIDELSQVLGEGGVLTEDIAKAMVDLRTTEQISSFARNIDKATKKDIFFEVWINALLSNPVTHAVNTISNSLVAAWQIPERLVAAGISKTMGTENGVQVTEALGQAYGAVEGLKDGLKAFARTVKSGSPEDVIGKIEIPINPAISSDALQQSGRLGQATDILGRGVRLPTTLLGAEDAFFKSVGYRMELHARAFRTATEEGLKGKKAATRITQILQDPPADLHLASVDAARYQTFTRPLRETGRAYQTMVATQPILRIVTPFVRTPTNIVKYFGHRSPFAPLAKSFQADFKAGGAKRDLAVARMALGNGIMMVAATMAAEGKITGGGPADPNLRSMKRNTGWEPYAIRVGDQYISYARLEPLGTLLGVAADFSEIAGELNEYETNEVIAHMSMAVAKNITSKTFLRGISEAINALDDPVRYGEKWWMGLMQTAVPSGVAQIARVQDPYLRETRTVMDRLISRTPGYSKLLPTRRNIWGESIQLSGGLGPDIISPFYTSEVKEDPVSEEMVRLELGISMPQRTIHGVELNPEQYDRLLILTGKEPIEQGEPNLKEAISDFINDPDYKELTDGPDGGKAFGVQKLVAAYRAVARSKLLEEDKELQKLVEENIASRMIGEQP